MRVKGLFHIYTGDGKGKTTCATGLAVRAFGAGKRVLVGQFLKGRPSAEVEVLRKLGIKVFRMDDVMTFSWQRSEEENQLLKKTCHEFFEMLRAEIASGSWNLVILDEAMGAWKCEGVCLDELCSLVDERPENVELVFTGRNAPEELIKRADYVSELMAIKHPYEQGIDARPGIDY